MILSRFLKSKSQPADPENLSPAQRLDSPDPAQRRVALDTLSDLDRLQQVARTDDDLTVRDAAECRYRAVFAGQTSDAPPLSERLARLPELTPQLLNTLLHQAVEPELRLAILERITDEAAWVEVAVRDPQIDVRLAALGRVATAEALEQIVRETRNRDKRIHRQARERLDGLATAKVRATEVEQLCVEMENLRWDGETGLNAGRFPRLEQEWRGHAAGATQEWQERYAQARTRFLSERQASANRRTQRLELIGSLESLLERLRHSVESNAELDASVQYATHEAPAVWEHGGVVQDSEGRRLERQFHQLVADIQEQQRILQRNQARAVRLRGILQQADRLLHQSSEVHESDLKQMRQHWESLERPETQTLANELQAQLDVMFGKLRARLQRQTQEREREWHELEELTAQLESAVENGELQQATALHEQARQRLKRNIGLSRAQMAQVDERLQACAGRIGELRGWRHWATHQVREQLCVNAEELIGLAIEPSEIAKRIQQLRTEWKDLDHREGAAAKNLWKRFNQACEQAYAPCHAYFAEQARERQQSFIEKTNLCEQLAQFEQETDWNQPNWREADRLRRRVQEQWRKLGPVNRADRKPLERRFQKVMQRLDAHLNAERDRELQRRQQLIEQVQALVDSDDLRTAIETAKRAQNQWHPTVQATPRQEQALWKTFRAACDAVFARRQAEQHAAEEQQQSNLLSKRALCEEVEAFATISEEQLAPAQERLAAIQKTWETLGAVPKGEQRGLEQRYESAVRQFNRYQRYLQRRRTFQDTERLHERDRLCMRLEALLPEAPLHDEALLPFAQEWNSLPPLAAHLLEPLLERFNNTCQALIGPIEQAQTLQTALEQNLARKKIWCVCMEIVAGVESPPEFAQLRMEYQVARLSASLAGAATQNEASYDAQQLQGHWRSSGALPAAAELALDERFMVALRAWWQRDDE